MGSSGDTTIKIDVKLVKVFVIVTGEHESPVANLQTTSN